MGKREVADSQWVVASAASTRRAANAAGSSSSSSQTAAVDSTQLMMRPPSTTMATATSSSSTTHAAAVTGAPATASRKTGRLMSLRRMIQDVQQQRLSSSARQRMQQRRSAPVGDVTSSSSVAVEAATVASAAPRVTAMGSDSAAGAGWSTPQRTTSAEAIDVSGSGAVTVSVADDLLEPATVNGEFSTTMSTALLDCALCAVPQPRCNFARVTSSCGHRACVECLRRYLTIEIMESRVNVECPACPERLHPNDVRRLLGNDSTDLVSKYEEFALRRLLVHDPDARWCPAPDCGYVVIASGCASCPKLSCERPGCGTLFCYHCKQTWHPNQTCDAARAERAMSARASSLSCSQDSTSNNEIKPCPRCCAFIIKMDDGSCNHMTCAVCGAEFCWLCMKEISDLHYLSPSGCTFWGKKPWSRKKKILWQLGTLVGAPVGISLIAAVAVPAIIIGVPIWVGRKLYARCSSMTKHKRNFAVAGGVISSILLSPVLAAVAVGIGVPLLLAYVYGVVPISLCRSGGCGVSTTDTGGVRIDFDESDVHVETAVSPFAGGDTRSVVETDGHHAINPSIGPSIGEMSVGMTNSLSASGSHLERVGVIREDCCSDRDSASHQAMAGSFINASLSGSLLAGPAGFHNRLEVQAEVSCSSASQHHHNHQQQQKRSSLSSESANFSMDAKSVTVSFGDNVSVMALAGSICAPRDKDNNSPVVSIGGDVCPLDNATLTAPPTATPTAGGACGSVALGNGAASSNDDQPSVVVTHSRCPPRCGSPPTASRSVSFVCATASSPAVPPASVRMPAAQRQSACSAAVPVGAQPTVEDSTAVPVGPSPSHNNPHPEDDCGDHQRRRDTAAADTVEAYELQLAQQTRSASESDCCVVDVTPLSSIQRSNCV